MIKTTEDEFGTLYVINHSRVRFTGNIADDVAAMEKIESLDNWLWNELESDASITDCRGDVVYAGADIQDHL